MYVDIKGYDAKECKACEKEYARKGSEEDASKCMRCAEGKTTTTEGAASCESCEIGMYGSQPGICEKCGTKKYVNIKGKTSCEECKIGEDYVDEKTACRECDLGKYGISKGVCVNCPAGRYVDGRGRTKCLDCPKDTYSTTTGKASVADCLTCNVAFAPFTTTGSKSGVSNPTLDCICAGADASSKIAPDGYYSVSTTIATKELTKTDPRERELCIPCPSGAICNQDGMFLEHLTAQTGHWRPKPTSIVFPACSQGHQGVLDAKILAAEQCCPVTNGTSICTKNSSTVNSTMNDTDYQCLVGYSGPLCLVCASNYVSMGHHCVICQYEPTFTWAMIPMVGASGFLFIAVWLFLMCGSINKSSNLTVKAKQMKRKKKLFGQMKILLSFLQIFGSMPGILTSVPWPPIFFQISFPFSFFNLDFISILSKASCSFSVRFFDSFLLHMMLPLFCYVAILLSFVTAKMCTRKDKKQRHSYINESVSKVIILVTLLLFPGLSTKIFQMWKCQSVDGIEAGRMLVQDFSMICGQGEHVGFTVIAIGFLFLYIIGIPVTMFVLLWKNKEHLHDKDSPKHHLVETALGGLYTQCTSFVCFHW